LSVTTESFQVPSSYPPQKSMVYDTDPEYLDITPIRDADLHFTPSILCGFWTTSHHHEGVSYEVGIGSTNTTDDIIPFNKVNETRSFCMKSSVIQTQTKYFFLLRSTCSAGSTISSSDGVIIVDSDTLRNSLVVQTGMNCFEREHDSITFHDSCEWNPLPVLVGHRYMVHVNNSDFEINSDDAIVERDQNHYFIVPFKSDIAITVSLNSSSTLRANVGLAKVYDCPSNDVISNTNDLTVNWRLNGQPAGVMPLYSVGVGEVTSSNRSIVIPFQQAKHNLQHRFGDVSSITNLGDRFVAKVRICSNTNCLDDVDSKPFGLEKPDMKLQVNVINSETVDQKSCLLLNARWEVFPEDIRISFHQYTLAPETSGGGKIVPWTTILNNNATMQVIYPSLLLHVH